MITGRDIVYISSIEWTFIWQQNQEIAVRLARGGNRVLYIENTGVRSPGLGDASRVFSRLKRWVGSLGSQGVREVAPNVFVCSPLVMPPFGSGVRHWINRNVLLRLVARTARQLGMRDVLVWTYLPTDTVLDLIGRLETQLSAIVYYCLADFPQVSLAPNRITMSEEQLVRSSDVVFVNCQTLANRFAPWTKDVYVFPPGVDVAAFSPLDLSSDEVDVPEELRLLPRPIIGYIGGLHRHVDFDLLAQMANARPDWSWVFVGPLQTSAEEISSKPNVRLLGFKDHRDLPDYVRNFDVCIVPYIKSAYTETVVPVKINEYLAAGKPVVSTDLPTIREFNAQHNVLIATENSSDKFLKAIEDALRLPKDSETIRRRRAVAALCDWNIQLEAMSRVIQNKLDHNKGEG